MKKQARIGRNNNGTLYDVYLPFVDSVHIEQMDAHYWWVGVYMKDGSYYHFDFTAKVDIDAEMIHDKR